MSELTVATYDQITTLLSKLATNYSNLFVDYETLFYSDTPADVTIQIYNAAGELETFTIPNRAKDRRYILNGEGSPEGIVPASKGAIYQDLTNGALYLKQVGDDSSGWYLLVTENTLADQLRRGDASPEGVEVAGLGTLYVDKTRGALYVKTTATGNDGWVLATANTAVLASVDLDNLSEEGEEHFANPSLSNLSSTGKAWIDSKENINNKVVTLNSLSTDTQYPSAKAVYNSINTTSSVLANKDLSNLTTTGEEHFLGKPQTRDCILYAPSGLPSRSGNVVSIPANTVLLGANGVNTNYTNKLTRKVLSSSLSVSTSYTSAQRGVVFVRFQKDTLVDGLVYCQEDAYARSNIAPTGYTTMVWYNPDSNTYKLTTNSGSTWTTYVMAEIARFTTSTTGAINSFTPNHPLTIATQDDMNRIHVALYEVYNTIYPVNSIYIGVMDTCPIASIVGTWEKVSSGRVLQGSDSSHAAGTTIAAGLPDHTHTVDNGGSTDDDGNWANYAWLATIRDGKTGTKTTSGASNSIYGNSDTVQPPAYVVNIWRRTA